MLHAAKAVLQLQGVAAESHAAVKRLFGLHVVRAGLVEPEWGSLPGESLDIRLTADYDIETSFSDIDARQTLEEATAFLRRIRELLLTKGFATAELPVGVLDA